MTREFGATAWGRAWLRQIEPVLITGPPDRDLPRARALARRAIEDLTIEANQVTARLTERGHKHTITLNIPIWNREEQNVVTRTIGQATSSRSGDLPDRLVTELSSVGVRIAPVPRRAIGSVQGQVDDLMRQRDRPATCSHLFQALAAAGGVRGQRGPEQCLGDGRGRRHGTADGERRWLMPVDRSIVHRAAGRPGLPPRRQKP